MKFHKTNYNFSFFDSLPQVYIIAEIGVNHNGDMSLAKQMILAAKNSGADAVKFQTYITESLASHETPKVSYQKNTSLQNETHWEMLKKLELSQRNHYELIDFCRKINIEFLSTPYDIESAKFLETLGLRFFKTASADIIDLPLHNFIASTGKPSIIATGMANLGEIERVVDIYDNKQNHDIILLHCVSNYPCSDKSLNILSIKKLAETFDKPVGFSDHSEGYLAAIMSVALGSKVIEKHFTLDKSLEGPDHRASSTPLEFKQLVENIRRAEIILGKAKKECQEEEVNMRDISRKSIVLARAMRAGEIIKLSDLALRRPGLGLGPEYFAILEGKSLRKDVWAGHRLSFSDLEEK